MFVLSRAAGRISVIVAAILLAACGGRYAPPVPSGHSLDDLGFQTSAIALATPAPCTGGCLYVTTRYFTSGCSCYYVGWVLFKPPFNASSSPLFHKSLSAANSIAADNVYLATTGSDLARAKVYHLPVTSSSAYFASIPLGGNPVYVAFDKSHDLWVANDNNQVEEFVPPFSSTMSHSLVLTMVNPLSIAFDSAKNLYIGRTDSLAGGFTEVRRYAPPYTGSYFSFYPGVFPTAMAIRGSTLAVSGAKAYVRSCNCWNLEMFNLPVTSTSSPTEIPFGYGDSAGNIAFDATGNLFVPLTYPAHSAPAGIVVYRPPFTPTNHGAYIIHNTLWVPSSAAIGP